VTSMGRWAVRDRRYKHGYRGTPEAYRAFYKWVAIFVVWCGVIFGVRNGVADLLVTVLAAWYAIRRVMLNWRLAHPPAVQSAASPSGLGRGQTIYQSWSDLPPNADPQGQPGWPPPATAPPVGERNSRTIPQDVKIKATVRDQGRCRQCGSDEDLHFDHVIPWSRGGANTLANIQILCGPCNRRKGADDIPAR
jgi:hypothetical protein